MSLTFDIPATDYLHFEAGLCIEVCLHVNTLNGYIVLDDAFRPWNVNELFNERLYSMFNT